MPIKTPAEIAKALCSSCAKKAGLPLNKMFVLAVLAGVYIGFGGQLMTTVIQDLSSVYGIGLAQFMGGSVFTVGLMLVVIGGAELFTGNNLIVIPCLSKGKKRADLETTSIRGLARNWGVVYVGNLVGSLLLALLVFGSGLYTMGGNQLGAKALAIANAKVQLPFIQALFRGILCNWLVCLAIWLSASADDTIGKIFAIYFPIMAFVAMGFEHSVANMFLIPMGILLKEVQPVVAKLGADLSNLTWEGFLINNLVPVTIGNIIGGAFFVGTIYWYAYLKDM